MTVFTHASVPDAINLKMIDTLVNQVETSPLPRVRDSAVRHLYKVWATLHAIVTAYERDLWAGDRILNEKTHEEQNAAPETAMWLEWLAAYQAAMDQIQRVRVVIAAAPDDQGVA